MSKIKNILFRADSSSTIGTGHIMRDLVLASQYKDSNIIFATQGLDGNINKRIKEAGYKVKLLKSNSLKEVIELVNKYNVDMVVIDHYGIDYKYEKKLKKKTGVKILSFDDTYEKHYCDTLLNHNIYAKKQKYKELVPKNCELKCGAKYTLLRDEFLKEKKRNHKSKKSKTKILLLAMGGTDHSNLNIKILKVIKFFPQFKINIITTSANKYLQKLKKYVLKKENITLHINTTSIAKLMNEADLAIITPSVTLNEVIYLSVPFIAIQTAHNQLYMTEYLKKHNYFILKKFDDKKLAQYIKTTLVEDMSL